MSYNIGSVNHPEQPVQSIEQQALSQANFRDALNVAFVDAEQLWVPLRKHREIWEGMATLAGQVDHNHHFIKVIDQNEYLVLIGFRTHYSGLDVCKLQIVCDGLTASPFILDRNTNYVVFTNAVIWRPDKQFMLTMLNGEGQLQFICVGATIYKRMGYGSLAFAQSSDNPEIVHQVDLKEEGSDARLRAFINGWKRHGETE